VEGKLQGLRLDHIDGLRDPVQYFPAPAPAGPRRAWRPKPALLRGGGENSRRTRKAAVVRRRSRTTGYEWMNAITQVLTDAMAWNHSTRSAAGQQPIAED